MKNRVARLALLAAAALVALVGCAARPGTLAQIPAPSARAGDDSALAKAAAQPSAPFDGTGWQPLFEGKTLTGWRVTEFGGHGPVDCEHGLIVLGAGDALTGLTWTNNPPTMNYEVALDALKVDGSDFFCGLTFPVGASNCSLILGGWGGGVVGLSSIDGNDASENETSQYMKFETGRWYRVRVRVTTNRIAAWLDDRQIVNLDTTGRTISLRYGDIELSKPLGVATWQTTGALREMRLRRLDATDAPSK